MPRKFILTALVVLVVGVFLVLYQGSPEQAEPEQPAAAEQNQAEQDQQIAEESSDLPDLPQQTAEMELVDSYSGDRAMWEILRLHRNDFPLDDGVVAIYQGENAEGVLWVSVSPDVEEATKLMQLMVQELPTSDVFREEDVFEAAGKTIYYVTGMGKDHYYWHDDLYVYWLQIDSQDPISELNVFLEY
ncbi:hypothetical protein [Dethiobacter alkaliphilus]|uniref:Uncharacterized protein n=1 Tax=Dethiobacter alkaliphilus AHT 1 TaxID=555088 RepID=C0GI53_DETAL|nr:hypothetical protein [Dethiobacter alkaliphilus]EEG76901.1 hypothetical protein DealDRAFT_2162 [Dethiobacter alkaliphilus AHT 1]